MAVFIVVVFVVARGPWNDAAVAAAAAGSAADPTRFAIVPDFWPALFHDVARNCWFSSPNHVGLVDALVVPTAAAMKGCRSLSSWHAF